MSAETFFYKGFPFQYEKLEDCCQEMPWDRSDIHGPVRYVRSNSSKKPGERYLSGNGNNGGYLYDWQEAMKLARHKWGVKTTLEACNAVGQDFNYLKGFLNGDWEYIGIVVCPLINDKPLREVSHSLWGIESFAEDTILEYAHNLAEECLSSLAELKATLSTMEL